MAYRSPPPSDFGSGRYPAIWARNRVVHTVAASKRFEIIVDGPEIIICNTDDPAEALILARLYAGTGSYVSVRDRSKRRGFLTEIELQALTEGGAHAL